LALIGVTVNALPAAPISANSTICAGESTVLTAVGSSVKWYSDAALTNLIGTGNAYNTGNLTASTTYYATQTNSGGCESASTTVIVTVNPLPTTPTPMGANICAGETATLMATGTGTVNWYSDPAGANLVNTGASFTTAILTQSTTYYIFQTDPGTGCISAGVPVTAVVNQLPVPPSATSPIVVCAGENVVLNATTASPSTLVFYDNANIQLSSTATGTNNTASYNAGALPTGNYNFSVRADDGTCLSTPVAIAATANALPAAPTTSNATICAGEQATLTATGTAVSWYSDAALTNLIATGNSYTTPVLTATTNYYTAQTSADGCEGAAATATVAVEPLPTAPTAMNDTICSGDTATLMATGTGTINWYSDAAGTALVGTGASFNTAILTQNTTFYAFQTNTTTGCVSVGVAVTAVVNALPATPSTATPIVICEGEDVVLQATGTGAGNLVFYDNTNTSLSSVPVGVNNSASYNVGALAAGSYSFYVREDDGNCLSNAVAVAAIVNALPSAPTAAGTSICAGARATLTATGTNLNWYSDAALTNLVGSGSTYTTSPLMANTDYYATQTSADGCEGSATTVTVTVNALPAAPVTTNASICAGQTATLTATGTGTTTWTSDPAGMNTIATGASFTTTALTQNTTYYAYQVDGGTGCQSGIATAQVTVNALPATPSVTTPIRVCEGEDVVLDATGAGSGSLVFYNNTGTQLSSVAMGVNNNASYNAGALTAGNYNYYVRQDDGTCLSNTVAIAATVNALPAIPSASDVTICAGATATLTANGSVQWYADAALSNLLATSTTYTTSALSASTDYYAVAVDANGCSSAADVASVTVDPSPTAPVAMNDTICSGSTATLMATAGANQTLTWYSDASANNAVGTGNSFTTGLTTQNSSYYVQATDASTGCSSALTAALVVVNVQPLAPAASPVSVCESNPVVLTATGSGTGNLVFYDNAGTQLASLPMSAGSATQSFSAATLAAGSYLYTVVETQGACESNPTTIVATVKGLPSAPTVFNDSPVCEGETVFGQASAVQGGSYFWTGPNSYAASTPTFSLSNITLAQAGTYDVVVTVDGCTSTPASTQVTVSDRPALSSATSNSPLCEGDDLSLTALGSVAGTVIYDWTGPNGFVANTPNAGIVGVSELDNQGFYNVVATDIASGCTSLPLSTLVMITSLPDAGMASSNSPVCVEDEVQLRVEDVFGATYTWTGPNGFASNDRTPTISNATTDATGAYSVTVTVGSCSSVYETEVAVRDASSVDAGVDTTLILGTPYRLQATGAAFYSWSPAANLDNPSASNPVFTAPAVGTYPLSVIGTTPGGCTAKDDVVLTVVRPSIEDIKIVDLFTPNNDGINDTWRVDFLQDATVGPYTLQIITRGGLEVLNTQNYQNDWDGTLNGQELPNGTYWYVIYLEQDDQIVKGAVTIKR
jgi:gliding motility-associated-like protein